MTLLRNKLIWFLVVTFNTCCHSSQDDNDGPSIRVTAPQQNIHHGSVPVQTASDSMYLVVLRS